MNKVLTEEKFINYVLGYDLDDIMGNKELINKLFDDPK